MIILVVIITDYTWREEYVYSLSKIKIFFTLTLFKYGSLCTCDCRLVDFYNTW